MLLNICCLDIFHDSGLHGFWGLSSCFKHFVLLTSIRAVLDDIRSGKTSKVAKLEAAKAKAS
jgi:hypothetical protein